MNKTTVADVTLSKVERTQAWWLYLCPFQSRRALLTTLALQAVGVPVMGALAYLVAPHAMFQVMIFSAAGGLLGGLYPLLPATMTVATHGDVRPALADLQSRLVKFGYVPSEQPPRHGRFHYRSKRSRFWRWDEQDIEVLLRNHELVLNGPVAVLALLRTRMLPPKTSPTSTKRRDDCPFHPHHRYRSCAATMQPAAFFFLELIYHAHRTAVRQFPPAADPANPGHRVRPCLFNDDRFLPRLSQRLGHHARALSRFP